ncbi:tripartite tricarboxylate transporter permease [Neorhizobium sp. T786]|uniref:tripartite tricarboxylate transporter permease n=1 Tax=Pseudorhizobium xiangyangii TaxID=2883104 RepID=UPI001CFFD5E7|nr:tripartite tricarboxylate transporter permease [Neorhizobium xiangyangii]MCB5204629.1 tripartite tricarboxylate transporter permease [Neorhizobium xiangyangii]
MDAADSVSMLGAAWEALTILADPMRLGVLCLAAFLGVVLGIVPGIGGLAGTALLLPFTFAMDPYTAFAFLLGLGATTSTGDPIPAILFGVPGGAGSAATVLDGLPMAKRGEAGRALSAAYMSSLMGGLFGALLLGISVPILRPVMLYIGTPEMLAISILGLSMVAALSSSTPLRGLAAAAIGVMISMIGSEPRTGAFRWTFESLYLWEGLPLVPLTLGLFALPELCDMMISRHSLKGKPIQNVNLGIWQGAKDCFTEWWLILRCSWIGTALGAIPGIGGSVVDWVAYAHAARTVKGGRQTFGKGDVRGVIASESSNNAKEGGSLITTIAFGIPGSAGMAIILGAFLSQGLVPGPDMLTKNLPITYSMVWSIAIANIIGAGLCYAFSPQFARLATLRYTLVLPVVVCIIFIGAYEGSRQWGDLVALLIFGLAGWTMKRLRWPRAPLILGVVLGDIIERQLFISIRLYGADWLLHPMVVVILCVAALGILRPVISALLDRDRSWDLNLQLPKFSPGDTFPVILLAAMAFLFWETAGWSWSTALVPQIVTGVAFVAVLGSLGNAVFRRGISARSPLDEAKAEASQAIHMDLIEENEGMAISEILRRALAFLGWLLGFLLSMGTIGIIPTIPLFVVGFMRFEGKERWNLVVPMAIGVTLFVYLVFDQLLTMNWPVTWIGQAFPALRVIPSV